MSKKGDSFGGDFVEKGGLVVLRGIKKVKKYRDKEIKVGHFTVSQLEERKQFHSVPT